MKLRLTFAILLVAVPSEGVFVNSPEERDQSGEAEECLGEFVMAGGDGAEVFDPLKEVLEQMALAID
jgi:hypothetical protein